MPMLCAPVAQAVTGQRHSPRRPKRMDRLPAAIFVIIVGMNRGFSRRGPFSVKVAHPFSNSSKPPMPVPKTQPMRAASASSGRRPDWAMASSAAMIAYWTKRAKRRTSFFVNPRATGS